MLAMYSVKYFSNLFDEMIKLSLHILVDSVLYLHFDYKTK